MKLLIITQILDKNDAALGFFHRWVLEFSKHCEQVTVICLKRGDYDLPSNVKVLSLGKEEKVSRLEYLYRFYKYIWQEKENYDLVFIHMNQVYAILGFPLWKCLGKKVGLWYAHGKVPFSLRIAEKCIDLAFASTKEGFRIPTRKLRIVGQGIDTEIFKARGDDYERGRMITVGRISKSKNIIDMLPLIQKKLVIIGEPISNEDHNYLKQLKEKIKELKLEERVEFLGSRNQKEVAEELRKSDTFINLSSTGSLDKAILEAMASDLDIICNNEAFKVLNASRNEYRMIVERDHNVKKLTLKIVVSYT